MFRRKKLFILIPTLLLIPLLLGMVPINMAHKLAQGGDVHARQSRLQQQKLSC